MASAVITTSIPRFLLPQATCSPVIRKALYRPRSSSSGASSSCGRVRHVSKKSRGNDGDKPIVLEKPLKFNPPSHGSRLPNKSGPRHYGGTLSDAEMKAQAGKDYPGLPPPPGTFGYKFWNSPVIHMYITIGTLGSLAIYTLSARFMETSPFASMVPSAYDFLRHPIESISTCAHIVLLHADWNTAQTMEKRRGSIEDVTKRRKYRRAHGIEDETVAQKLLPESWTKPTEESMEAAYGDGTVIEEATKKDGGDGKNEEKKKSWGTFFGA